MPVFIEYREKKTNEVFINPKDKVITAFFLIKYLLFDSQITSYSKITVNSFFFNRKKLVSRLLKTKRILGLDKMLSKKSAVITPYEKLLKNYNKLKITKKLKLFLKESKLPSSNFLRSKRLYRV